MCLGTWEKLATDKTGSVSIKRNFELRRDLLRSAFPTQSQFFKPSTIYFFHLFFLSLITVFPRKFLDSSKSGLYRYTVYCIPIICMHSVSGLSRPGSATPPSAESDGKAGLKGVRRRRRPPFFWISGPGGGFLPGCLRGFYSGISTQSRDRSAISNQSSIACSGTPRTLADCRSRITAEPG